MTISVAGPRGSSKALPKAKLAPKKVMVTGSLLPIWSTTAFWVPVKPLYLRSMLSRSMRCTENCNDCSWHWSTERAQFFSTTLNHTSKTKASKVDWIGLRSFALSIILTHVCAKSLQSCLTLCDPMDCSPPGFSIHEVLQAKNTGVGCHAFLNQMAEAVYNVLTTSKLSRKEFCFWLAMSTMSTGEKLCYK